MRLLISLFVLAPLLLSAQYTTPNTGVHWNLDSLVIHSGGVVAAGVNSYNISENLIIAENDSLTVLTTTMTLNADVLLTIEGYSFIGGIGPILESSDIDNIYEGVRIEESGEAYFDFVRFLGGGGVKCISGDVIFTHCEFMGVQHIATNNAALELFAGSPEIDDCIFENSLGSAISSPANIACAPLIFNSVFIGNNTENTNRPQINLGPSGSSNSIQIIGNMIQGNPELEMVGGIATTSLFGEPSNVNIQDNTIISNRYGITVSGGSLDANIYNNLIEDNNTQNEPLLGGSGINLNGPASNYALLEENIIRNNLWGITVQGEFGVDMGNLGFGEASQGNNTFSGNANGGQTYALFNNTPNPINAENNCWIEGQESTLEQIEDVISHQNDDAELGLVNFSEYQCGIVDGLDELDAASLLLYPNPSVDYLYLKLDKNYSFNSLNVLNLQGQLVLSMPLPRDSQIDIRSLRPGQYVLELIGDQTVVRHAFVKE